MSTKKTGWEALDKWVGDSSSGGAAADAAPASGEKKTGWEALDKWVGSDGGGSAPASGEKKTGWEALDKWVGPDGAPTEAGAIGSTSSAGSSSGGGFMGWLKRLFGGK